MVVHFIDWCYLERYVKVSRESIFHLMILITPIIHLIILYIDSANVKFLWNSTCRVMHLWEWRIKHGPVAVNNFIPSRITWKFWAHGSQIFTPITHLIGIHQPFTLCGYYIDRKVKTIIWNWRLADTVLGTGVLAAGACQSLTA